MFLKYVKIFSSNTRFCIICNYISRIIEPIMSRCAVFRFNSIPQLHVVERLQYISQQENIKPSKHILQLLCQITRGDLRKSISLLQSIHYLKLEDNEEDSREEIFNLIGTVSPGLVEQTIQSLLSGSCQKQLSVVNQLILQGYEIREFIYNLSEYITKDSRLTDLSQSKLLWECSLAESYLRSGTSELLVMMHLTSLIRKYYPTVKKRKSIVT